MVFAGSKNEGVLDKPIKDQVGIGCSHYIDAKLYLTASNSLQSVRRRQIQNSESDVRILDIELLYNFRQKIECCCW